MFKKLALLTVLAVGSLAALSPTADAGIYYRRVAPVRRVAARAVLPPYPIARRAVVGPVYRGYYGGYGGYGWGGYGPGVSVRVW